MLILIAGGSGSGKSKIAESICMKLKTGNLYYIATMKIWDSECEKRIEKHRNQRKNKGFITLEVPCSLHDYVSTMKHDSTALLECIGNLTANEQFDEKSENPVNKIVEGIVKIYSHIKNLVIVSNDIFCDGDDYNTDTLDYMKNIAEINKKISESADIVMEVCCGIPIIYKGKEIYNEIFD